MVVKKGIIYLMTTIVPGLVKIGKTQDFKGRMQELEHNGYCNVTGLKREFAIEVDDYDEKELTIQDIFANNRVGKTELFALDTGVVIKLLMSMSKSIVYPENTTETEIMEVVKDQEDSKSIPNGIYSLAVGEFNATVEVVNDEWIIKKGSKINTNISDDNKKAIQKRMLIQTNETGTVLEDCNLGVCYPSCAGNIVLGRGCNGWTDLERQKWSTS